MAEFAVANCAILLGSLVQTTAGMGFAMVSVPLLALISLDFVPGPTIFVNLFLTVLMLKDGRATIVRQEMLCLLPAILTGTVLGAVVLAHVPLATLGVLFALLVLLAVVVTFIVKVQCLTPSGLIIGGVAAGLMGTTSGIHGPPLAVIYQHEPIQKIRATLALVFLIAYTLSLLALALAGEFNVALAVTGLLLLPGLLLGFQLGKRVRQRVSPARARMITLAIASVSAVMLLVKSLQ